MQRAAATDEHDHAKPRGCNPRALTAGKPFPWHLAVLIATLAAVESQPAAALDYVTLRHDGRQSKVAGRLLVEAQDGGLLLLARDGVLWTVQPEDLVRRTRDDVPFEPLSAEELSTELLGELPQGFAVHRSAHYVILYNTSREYAVWCGSLFERLYAAFVNCWSRKGFQLSDPEFPLVAIVFADQRSYVEHARKEVGDAAQSMLGYFSLRTNRMTMVDLTGAAGRRGRGRTGAAGQIHRILAQPEAERTVATIVHEATHQIAFNCGLHTRLSDCPLWFSEGIAIYFETPDLNSSKGWSTVGAVSRSRLEQFRSYSSRRPADSLVTLLSDDKRLRNTKDGLDAYAEAWALTCFLMHQHPKQYVAYLGMLAAKKPMFWDDPQTRLREFKQAFGDDLDKLDAEFTRYILRLR